MKDECGRFHNLVVELIVALKLEAQDTIYVLELIKQEIMESEMRQRFKPKLSDKKPTEMG